jgi:uncharacterized protein YgbK (DUF1537 family)
MADRSGDHLPELARRAAARPAVILDDDPTGTQTLRDVFVLTSWDADSVARHLHDPAVFLSTNSRSLDEAAAVAITHDAAVTAVGAARISGRPISIISRSDSTLRGHFPAETAAVADAMEVPDARVLLAPYFGEGGRLTIDGVHYLLAGATRRPVGETEFARDASFGYRSSNLAEWVAEKYGSAGKPPPFTSNLTLRMIRDGGPEAVAAALLALPARAVGIADAEVDRDIEIVALGVLIAEEEGLPIVARTAASYVRGRAGREPAPILTAEELATDGPGLIVVGSHVATTTRQLEHLAASMDQSRLVTHELAVEPILAGDVGAVDAAIKVLEDALRDGRSGLVSTERGGRDVGLEGARAISSALVAIIRGIETRPAWVIAKGGITSSDVAGRGLEIREARVAGQLLPGVPVWIGTEGSRWPGVPLVVFPGNVGSASALADALGLLSARG